MKIFKKIMLKVQMVLMVCTISFISGNVAKADDIELYEAIFNALQSSGGVTSVQQSSNDPNVLFILDNSGSMKQFKMIKEGTPQSTVYDPNTIYGNELDTDFYLYDTSYNLIAKIKKEQNVCKAAKDKIVSTPSEPFFQDEYTQWQGPYYGNSREYYRWGSRGDYFSYSNNRHKLECESDNGVHGKKNTSRNKYLKRCDQGYCLIQNGNRGPRYSQYRVYYPGYGYYDWPYDWFNYQTILVSGNYHRYLLSLPEVDSSSTAVLSNCTENDKILTDATTGQRYRCLTRMEIMKRALSNVIGGDPQDANDQGISNVNVGLMRFNYNARKNYYNQYGNYLYSRTFPSGGTLVDAIAPANGLVDTSPNADPNGKRNKEDFLEKLDDIDFEGNTPLAESMYEAYLYFSGGKVLNSEKANSSPTPNQSLVLDSSAVTNIGGSDYYIDPRTVNRCQSNYVVMLSDGAPTQDTDLNNKISQIGDGGACSGNCLDEAAAALKKDLGVYTYTIGFTTDQQVLKDAARKGSANDDAVDGDGYFLADDITSLTNAFTSILTEIQLVENDSFVAPAVTVNAFNRLQNRSDLYYAVFEPGADPRWKGNLKKYRVNTNGVILDNSDPAKNAIDVETGFFAKESKSFWSDDVDGNVAGNGGMAAELPSKRRIFASLDSSDTVTYLGNTDDNGNNGPVNFAKKIEGIDGTGAILGLNQALSGNFDNSVNNNLQQLYNNLISSGTTNDLQVDNFFNIIRWTLGEDINNEVGVDTNFQTPNQFIGESIHSTPFVVSYGLTDAEPKDIVFSTTNQGMLHATSAQESNSGGFSGVEGGQELWSYIPDSSLLKNLGGYYNKELNGDNDHIYGLDAPMSHKVYRDENNKVTGAYVFFGQRRGGNKYFGIDITNADEATEDDPVKKLWTVQGGTGDLLRMAQTWSKPVITKMRVCSQLQSGCTEPQKNVLVVAGGYDTKYDDASKSIESLAYSNTSNTMGNAIYVLDATDGSVLWAASNTSANVGTVTNNVVVPSMKHSFVSAPTVLDVNKDGAIDLIYAVDIAGQVFRFDFQKGLGTNTSEVYSGGKIFDLSKVGVKRRFYNPIDVVLLPASSDGAPARYALITGSGYRAHPLDTENEAGNRFYVMYDQFLKSPKIVSNTASYDYFLTSAGGNRGVKESDISEIKTVYNDPNVDENDVLIKPNSTHKYGYYFEVKNQSGEKILNPTLIADFQMIGVSYIPKNANSSNTAGAGKCSAAAGQSATYKMDLLTGQAKRSSLTKPGISAPPVLLYLLETDTNGNESLKPVVVVGTEPFKGSDFDIKDLLLGKAEKKGWWEVKRRN